jgi:hypothetical protein
MTEILKNCHGSVLLPQPPLTENLMTETMKEKNQGFAKIRNTTEQEEEAN